MNPFAWNVLLAAMWASVTGDFSPGNLVAGFLAGYVVLVLASPVLGRARYGRRVAGAAGFIAFFLWELLLSNLRVAREVIAPRQRMRPAVVAIPLDVRKPHQITLLANLITLTPGTLSLDVSKDRKVLYIHTMHCDDVEATRRSIKEGFERRILEVLP